jgi:hypothetical protein
MLSRHVGSITHLWEKRQLNVGLAREPDAYPVMVRVSGELDDVLIGRIETRIAVFSDVREDN